MERLDAEARELLGQLRNIGVTRGQPALFDLLQQLVDRVRALEEELRDLRHDSNPLSGF